MIATWYGDAVPFGAVAKRPRRRHAPPAVSRGVHSQDLDGVVSVHWLQGTLPHDRVDGAIALVARFFPECELLTRDYGRNGYNFTHEWSPYGIKLWTDTSRDRADRLHGGRACLCIPGSALDGLDGERVRELFRACIHELWLLGTRVDVAFDDFSRSIAPYEVAQVAECGNFTGYRRWQHQSPRRLDGSREGDLVAFGRRGRDGSGRFLRCYDKGLESDGLTDSVRWEVEFSKERAREVVFRLSECRTVAEFGGLAAALVGGAIDFVERTERAGDKNLARLARCSWWASIVERLGRVGFGLPARVPSVEKTRCWIAESLPATLFMLREAVGPEEFGEWLTAVVEDGATRVSARHRGMLNEFWRSGWTPWTVPDREGKNEGVACS